jgi:nucleoside triphosphate pyrophosphatase
MRPSMERELAIILASGSPRRRQLLAAAGLSFRSAESGVHEERGAHEGARNYALRLARDKAVAVSAREPDALVIGADTVVECAGEILEKPVDAADAHRMLRRLAARTHTVVTAFAIARAGRVASSDAVISRVTFRNLTDREIDEYVATGEPFDKAGGYGIQGLAAGFIAAVDGPRDNVMGLPVRDVLAALEVARGALRVR